MTTFAIGSAQY